MLTGFLGSGKTTLLKSLLNSYTDQKVAVIVNEFGELNIDGVLLQSEGVQMAELSNGSIFCACIKDKFVDSLIEMSTLDIDVLFIEASGLADPANMSDILAGIKAKTNDNLELLGSVVVTDAQNFAEMSEMLPALANQVEYASVAIVNKSDLADKEEIENTVSAIKDINPQIRSFITSQCNVDIPELINSFVKNEKTSKDSTNTVESRPNTFVVKAQNEISLSGLRKFLEDICTDSYRIKGFVKTDQGNVEVSCVGKQIEINDWEGHIDNTQLVVISSIGIKLLSMILKASKDHVDGALKL